MQMQRSQPYNDSVALAGDIQVVISQVYLLMTIGLMITAVVAAVIAGNPQWMLSIFGGSPVLLIGLFVAQIALVIALTAAINKLSAAMATAMFVLYSALTGVTLSAIFWVYTDASIVTTFVITAGMFGVMSFIGLVTKRDLTKLGGILTMALIGFFIASVVNLFLRSTGLYWLLTFGGIVIFVGLVAWDTQRIKQLAAMGLADGRSQASIAVMGALRLYLDFINLFLLLLRVFGKRR